MIMSVLANIHPGLLEFYVVSIINYINYRQGPGPSAQASCTALTAPRFPSLQNSSAKPLGQADPAPSSLPGGVWSSSPALTSEPAVSLQLPAGLQNLL